MAKYYPVDWQDGVLRDGNWLTDVPGIQRGICVLETRLYPEPDNIEIDIAVGAGIGGRNALRITCKSSGTLPDFRIISKDKTTTGASAPTRPRFSDGYLCPPNFRPKKIHLLIKFPNGFRDDHALATETTESQNYHFGTHHSDPGILNAGGLSGGMLETYNWHQYHQISVRHDLAADGWVHMVCSATPTHQRSRDYAPAPEVTAAHGRYWDTAVTVYFAPVPYGDDQTIDPSAFLVDIPVPYEVLIDSIYFTDDEEYQPVQIEFVDYRPSQELEALSGVATSWYQVRLTNTTAVSVSGIVIAHGASTIPELRDANTLVSVQDTNITLASGEVRILEVRGTAAGDIGNPYVLSVVFIPSTEESRPRYGADQIPSKTDPYVCYREYHGYFGPPDADVCQAQIVLRLVSSLTGTEKPWTWGGEKWRCSKNSSLTRQVLKDDPQGLPVTVTLIDYDAVPINSGTHTTSGGGTLTINSAGLVSYMPTTDFEGTIFFRYQLNNGIRNSDIFGNWINVVLNPRIAKVTSNKVYTLGGKLITIG